MALGDKHIPNKDGWPYCKASSPMNGYYATSPSCQECQRLQHELEYAPLPHAQQAYQSRTFSILGEDNGYGLSRDREILTTAFHAAGWKSAPTEPNIAVSVHLEQAAPHFLTRARHNVFIPNPEWWPSEQTALLRHPSVVIWAKTQDALRIFNDLGARVSLINFRSKNQLDSTIPRERSFLHVAGVGPNKHTATLLNIWRPEWPPLTITINTSSKTDTLRECANVHILQKMLSADEIRTLQNRYLFHIYPSRYEGFGHAPWEGLSCGAIVFVPDGPPFEDWPKMNRIGPVTSGAPSSNQLVRWITVSEEAIATAIARAMALAENEIAELRQQARARWEATRTDFEGRIAAQIALLDDCAAVTTAIEMADTVPIRAPLFTSPTPHTSNLLTDMSPVTYVGRVNCVTGQGAAARHQIHVLRRHGLRLTVVDAGSNGNPDPGGVDPFIQAARASDPGVRATRGTIFHLQPNIAEMHRQRHARPHILVSVWETTRLPTAWVPLINSYDQVWCATEWQRGVYLTSGVAAHLLHVVPFALDADRYAGSDTLPEVRGHSRTVFGSVFQWSERKNPRALLSAYLHAFHASDDVALVLKGYEGDDPSNGIALQVDQIVRSLHASREIPQIQTISGPMADLDMLAFYRSCDCYVSAHRGEGFGLPIAEALLVGTPVIATNWSAPAEYAAGLFRGVGYIHEPPHGMNWQPFYTVDQLWASVDVRELAEALREAHERHLVCPSEAVRERFAHLVTCAGKAARAALETL